MANSNLLTSKINKKELEFIRYIASGSSVKDAYILAGYRGINPQQPYQLKYKLKNKITQYLEDTSFNRDTVAIEISKLLNIPLDPSINYLTVTQKIRTIGLLSRSLPDSGKPARSFSRFQILIANTSGAPVAVTVNPSPAPADSLLRSGTIDAPDIENEETNSLEMDGEE